MTNIITVSLDEDSLKVLERMPRRLRSKFIRDQVIKYDSKNILPSMIEITERLKHEKEFEVELIGFINSCRIILDVRD